MKKKFLTYFVLVCIGACQNGYDFDKIPKNDRVDLAIEQEFAMTRDPGLNTIPKDRLFNGVKQMKQQIARTKDGLNEGVSTIIWEERGPDNIAGRTRAILLDKKDESRNTLLAGGVSGGLWRTTNLLDENPDWSPIDDFWANLMVTCIAQDPNNPDQIYVGTGEGWFKEDDRMKGFGIWASTDGGLNFEQLPLTRSDVFSHIQDIVVDTYGVVYAATRMGGVMRSEDGGQSWTQVLGLTIGKGATNRAADLEIGPDQDLYATLGIHSEGSLWKADFERNGTNRGKNGTWENISPPQGAYSRIEVAVAPSDANVIYFLAQGLNANDCEYMFRSENGGLTWQSMLIPKTTDGKIFTRGQAWHNLIAAVDPNKANRLFIGGVNLYISENGGRTFNQFTHDYGASYQYVHADQHAIQFAEGSSDFILFGNDGGVWLTTDGSSPEPTVINRNKGYNVTQFYAGAIHPFNADYMLGGTQDNGTQQFTDSELLGTNTITGGDGGFAHIDEDFGYIQISSYLYNYYWITGDGWQNKRKVTIGRNDGRFINPTDYDSQSNTLYTSHKAGYFGRIADVGNSNKVTDVAIAAFNGDMISAVKTAPNTKGRVYFGLGNGNIVRVDEADTGSPISTIIKEGEGYVSCIEVEEGNEDHLLVTYSNYGVISIWESMDGGLFWKPVEGDLPDMPVRWAIFNPVNSNSALIATELGVWGTDKLESVYTNWTPVNTGMANVRTDMLQYDKRSSRLMAATHGRGVFITDVFNTDADEGDFVCDWTDFPGTLKQISVTDNQVWGVNALGDLMTYQNGQWQRTLREIIDVGIGATGHLVALSADFIYESPSGVTWTGFGGLASRVDIAGDGIPYLVSKSNYIYAKKAGTWERIPGRALDIGCGADGSVYMVGYDKHVYKWNGSSWNEMPNSSAIRIDVDKNGLPWIINTRNEVLRFTGTEWEQMSAIAAQDISCDGLGNTYITSLTDSIHKWNCTVVDEVEVDTTTVESIPFIATSIPSTERIEAFPNPFTNQINLRLDQASDESMQVTIFDQTGQIRYNYEGSPSNQTIMTNDSWPIGIYWMQVRQKTNMKTLKLIKVQR